MVVIISVCPPLGSSATGPHCFKEFSIALLVQWGQKTLSTGGWGCDLVPCLGEGKQALGPIKSGRSAPPLSSLVKISPYPSQIPSG